MANNTYGPGAVAENTLAPNPLLEDATDNEVITILNPLNGTFVGKWGIQRPVNEPLTPKHTPGMPSGIQTEADLNRAIGYGFKNPDHFSTRHITNTIEIPAGETRRMQGSAAKVVVGQLVTAIMQSRKQQLLLADPNARHLVEQEVVIGRVPVADFYDQVDPNKALQNALDKSNGANNEPEFPDLGRTEESSSPTGTPRSTQPGDPATGLSTPSQAPGTLPTEPKA